MIRSGGGRSMIAPTMGNKKRPGVFPGFFLVEEILGVAVEGFGKPCGGIEGEFVGASFASFYAANDVDVNA